MSTFTVSTELTTINCSCGGVYAITEVYRTKAHERGETWTCPYCRTWWGYSGNSLNAKLKRQLEEERRHRASAEGSRDRWRDSSEHESRRAASFKGQVTKIKNRVGNGVCPCCNRTFADLARHMKSKHPEYAGDTEGGETE